LHAPVCDFIPGFIRRRPARGEGPMSTLAFRKLVQRIREELEASPDFRMNLSEAAKFCGLDLATCWQVLTELRVIGVVSRETIGRDDRPDEGLFVDGIPVNDPARGPWHGGESHAFDGPHVEL
jgi:hypothetical protein